MSITKRVWARLSGLFCAALIFAGCQAEPELPTCEIEQVAAPVRVCYVGEAPAELEGTVVDLGTGVTDDECNMSYGPPITEETQTHSFSVEDSEGAAHKIGLALPVDTLPFAVGDAVRVHIALNTHPHWGTTDFASVQVDKEGAPVLVVSVSAGAGHAIPEMDVSLGESMCKLSSECGSVFWAAYALASGESTATLPYGGADSFSGWTLYHGGGTPVADPAGDCLHWWLSWSALAAVADPN